MTGRPDVMIVSFPKSGRTWIRVFLSRYRQQLLSLPGFDIGLHRRPGEPGVTYEFTHAGADPKFGFLRLRKHLMRRSDRPLLGGLPEWCFGVRRIAIPHGFRRYLFLVRDPRDVLVSFYYQARDRNRFWTGDIDTFARNRFIGIERIVTLMNHLAARSDELGASFFFYEELRADPEAGFRRLLEAAGDTVKPGLVREAVTFSSFDNMRSMELSGGYGKRLTARRKGNPDSLKTRRGKIGGYRDELPGATIGFVEQFLDDHLDPEFSRYAYRT